jgi:hypothetical protein
MVQGAKVHKENVIDYATKQRWQPAQYFNFSLKSPFENQPFPLSIPQDVPLDRVYADFFAYLCGEVKKCFCQMYGENTWVAARSSNNVEFVVAYPDRWDGNELEVLRKAMLKARLVYPEDAMDKINFVPKRKALKSFIKKKVTRANFQVW